MEYKVLEEQDLELMEDVLKDDNMIFNKELLIFPIQMIKFVKLMI